MGKRKDSGKSRKELDTIVVHRFSAEVSGKAQKHSRVGVREFVSFEDFGCVEFSISKTCMKHYGMLEMMLIVYLKVIYFVCHCRNYH